MFMCFSFLKTIQMTNIGKFTLDSETVDNPSMAAFFLTLTGPAPLKAADVAKVWKDKGLSERHGRFSQSVQEPGYFYPAPTNLATRITQTMFPMVRRAGFVTRQLE